MWVPLVAGLAIVTMTVANLAALMQDNLKRLLAFSSVAQIGYIILGASFMTSAGLTASTMHMFNHALAKGALFLTVACLATSLARVRMDTIGGIARKMPWTMAAFVLAGLSLIGVPGTAGFISKWYLISAVFDEGSFGLLLVAVIVVSSLMAVVYIWRVVESAYFQEGSDETTASEAPLALLVPTWIAILLNFCFGLLPALPVELAETTAQILLGRAP